MSANKILSTIVAAEDCEANEDTADKLFGKLHDFTFGITSDPLTHLACLFSAMVHDVDHSGVSNMQLCKEKDELAIMYENKSVLEQNSIDLAWEMLMEPSYSDLRSCLFPQEEDMHRFRKLLVNSILATDIFDTGESSERVLRQKDFGWLGCGGVELNLITVSSLVCLPLVNFQS